MKAKMPAPVARDNAPQSSTSAPLSADVASDEGYVDARPAAVAQRQMQQLADGSPRALQFSAQRAVMQRGARAAPLQAKAVVPPNRTGLPNQLKAGVESLSGMRLDHVQVHYNSDKPAQLNAHAYAQGGDIHVAPGQERHLPHEAWHVVQQAQGRVRPTMQMKAGVPVNDDRGLEAEADAMGAQALRQGATLQAATAQTGRGLTPTLGAHFVLQNKPIPEWRGASSVNAEPIAQLQNNGVVAQRALSDGIMEQLKEWVKAEAEERGVHKKHMALLMKKVNELKDSVVLNTLEDAKARLNAAFFKQFVDMSDITRMAEHAIKYGGATNEEVEAVLQYLRKERIARFLSAGQIVYLKRLPGADLDKNCHHYAFGGLKGADAQFSYPALNERFDLAHLANGAEVDASTIPGVDNEVEVVVRSYGEAHSAREGDGVVWHKFIGIPCLFAIPSAPDLGNAVVKTFRVKTAQV